MRTWTTTTTVDADPDAALGVLTDPRACRRCALDTAISRLAREAVVTC